MDEITLDGMVVDCFVGLYPHEQQVRQPLRVDLSLYLDVGRAGRSGRIKDTADYAQIGGEIRFLLEASRYHLIETACEALASHLLAPPLPGYRNAAIEEVTVRMSKPTLSVNSGTPLVKIHRRRQDYEYEHEERPFGRVDVIFTGRECGIYRLRLAPGSAIPTHIHRVMDESELILTDGLLLQGQPAASGLAHRWPKDFPHRYDNETEVEQTILCVDAPPFIPEDEIIVERPPGDLAAVPAVRYFDTERYLPR